MSFKTLYLAHAPDADYKLHRSQLETGVYKLFSVAVKTQADAIAVSKEYLESEQIDSITLCPGFSHSDIAEIIKATGNKVAVAVARSDGPGNKIALDARVRAGHLK